MKNTKPEDVVAGEVEEVLALEQSLQDVEAELSKNEQFRSFLEKQKEAKVQIANTWKQIEDQMLEHNIKSLKGDWGSITIAERLEWVIVPSELANKFYKKVVDTAKISATFRLEGKAPKGTEPIYKKYLTKRIK